jgi:hypothetical protein
LYKQQYKHVISTKEIQLITNEKYQWVYQSNQKGTH